MSTQNLPLFVTLETTLAASVCDNSYWLVPKNKHLKSGRTLTLKAYVVSPQYKQHKAAQMCLVLPLITYCLWLYIALASISWANVKFTPAKINFEHKPLSPLVSLENIFMNVRKAQFYVCVCFFVYRALWWQVLAQNSTQIGHTLNKRNNCANAVGRSSITQRLALPLCARVLAASCLQAQRRRLS